MWKVVSIPLLWTILPKFSFIYWREWGVWSSSPGAHWGPHLLEVDLLLPEIKKICTHFFQWIFFEERIIVLFRKYSICKIFLYLGWNWQQPKKNWREMLRKKNDIHVFWGHPEYFISGILLVRSGSKVLVLPPGKVLTKPLLTLLVLPKHKKIFMIFFFSHIFFILGYFISKWKIAFFFYLFFSQFFVCLFLDILSQILKWHAFYNFSQSFLQNFVLNLGYFFNQDYFSY